MHLAIASGSAEALEQKKESKNEKKIDASKPGGHPDPLEQEGAHPSPTQGGPGGSGSRVVVSATYLPCGPRVL